MKPLLIPFLAPLLALVASAQDKFQTPALLESNGKVTQAYILAATKTDFRYKTTAVATQSTDAKIANFNTIYILRPAAFTEAMDLFENGEYAEAQDAFAKVKETHKPTLFLTNNYSTQAAYMEMECMRKLGNFEGLAAALASFDKAPLTRKDRLDQLELYPLWGAISKEDWASALDSAKALDKEKLPGPHRAQVAYVKGLALQKTGKTEEAIVSYNIALTADSGGSESVAQQATENLLKIYLEDEQVITAKKSWGSEDERKNSPGYRKLSEAAALANLYETTLSNGTALPDDLKAFREFASKPAPSETAPSEAGPSE